MIAAGVGDEVSLALGGRVDMPALGLKGQPLRLTGLVRAITEGEFLATGPMATSSKVRMGRTAVRDTGSIQILGSKRRSEPYDLRVFTHCGIDPKARRYVIIKSRLHFRAGFVPIARHIVMYDGDGCCASDLALLKYENIVRPLYPFDSGMALQRNAPEQVT
jgi:microcystin degradation protein MlrC